MRLTNDERRTTTGGRAVRRLHRDGMAWVRRVSPALWRSDQVRRGRAPEFVLRQMVHDARCATNDAMRLRLSLLLTGLNVGLLLAATTGVALVAAGLLQQFADDQALARVTQTGAAARYVVDSAGERLQITAQLLAERPTLQRLLRAEDAAGLEAFLGQFRATGRLAGAAVLRDGRVVAASGAALPWTTTPLAAPTPDLLPSSGELALVAHAPVASVPGALVVVTMRLDSAFAAQVSAQVGLPVTILAPAADGAPAAQAALRRQALATGAAAAGRIPEADAYIAALPLQNAKGDVAGVLEVRLPATGMTRARDRLIGTLAALALAVATVAALVSFVAGRRFVRPLQALTSAARRIGAGDLQTPVVMAPGAEIGTLAATLEEMRQRLFQLTNDLRRQQGEAQAIITGIVEGVFTVDEERRIRFLNPQATTLLGISPEEALGRFCGDVLNPQEPDGGRPCATRCPILQARAASSARATERLALRSGQHRTVVITSAAPAEGQQVQVLRDETDLETIRRARDAVLANISHEFRTPLSAQLASIELLIDRLPELTTDQVGQLVRALQRGTLRLTRLIDNLLESVRIESGQAAIRHAPVALDEVIEEAVELTRPLLSQRRQDVVLELPYPLPPVLGDGPRLTQVFVNLLANANKYAPAASPIRIGGAVSPRSVTLFVQDCGPGPPPLAGATMFDRFVRAAAEEPEQSGMGLGLWIVRSIIERHGGEVGAQHGPDGTRMFVTLPLPQEDGDR